MRKAKNEEDRKGEGTKKTKGEGAKSKKTIEKSLVSAEKRQKSY